MRKKVYLSLVVSIIMVFFTIAQSITPVQAAEAGDEKASYEAAAVAIDLNELPGVYTVKAKVGDGMGDAPATMGIPSVAKQTLADKPTTESPAIIMGAAVNYEEKVGPTEFKPFKEGTDRVAPYSYFRHAVIDEQIQDVDGNITTHKKMSGFDGSYYIIRVDVSDIVANAGEGKYLHVKQESNKALMAAYGMEGSTFSDALGNKTGSYSLDESAKAMKDNGKPEEIPYFDVIILSSGKLSAGADTGSANAPSADIKLSFYVDDVKDYKPNLPFYETANMPTFPATIDGVEYKAETDYIAALLTKFFDDSKATAANKATKYLIKGSDLEIDVMVDEKENPDHIKEFWSLTKAIAYQKYDSHVVKLICEVPVLEGLSIEGSADNKRSVILDVNSFDIQIANNTEQNQAGLSIGGYSEMRLMDGSNTAGAELAIGNNATMVIKQNGVLIIDETCTNEVEFDAASVTDPTQKPTTEQVNGEITILSGGKVINYGVINVEGTEAKPQPQDPAQAAQEQVIRDIRSAFLLVQEGGTLENHGAISLKGDLYVMGTLTNDGKYKDTINANDPDKGTIAYHKGIQVTWKDDVRNKDVRPGTLNIGIDSDKKIVRTAKLVNTGDIVVTPGEINVYGTLENSGNIYLADVTEAIVPIQPTAEQPLVVEIRVAVDPMRPGLIKVDKGATLKVADGSVKAGAVKLISNGVLGDLTVGGEAKGVDSMIKADDFVISATDGTKNLVQNKDFTLKDGGVTFSEAYLASFGGERTVKLNIGYRIHSFKATGTMKGVWKKVSGQWKYQYVDKTFAKSTWEEIGGKWYYFDKNGIMESNAYRGGYYLTKSGAWDGKAVVSGWTKDSDGWWFRLTGGSYLKNTWKKINGKWYYFNKSGYMASNEFVKGYWVRSDGAQTDPVIYKWHKDSKGWWYGKSGGWYAKSKSYRIDGKTYSFNKAGYCTNP